MYGLYSLKSIRGMANFFNSFRQALFAERDRWPLWLPLPLALGIAAYFGLKAEPPLPLGPAMLLILAAVGVVFHSNRVFLYGWTIVFLFALGFTAGQVRTWHVTAPVLLKKVFVTAEGRVVEVTALEKGLRLVIENPAVLEGDMKGQTVPARIRIRLKAKDPAQVAAGDVVRVKAVLLPLSPPVLPGAFDFQRHAFFQRLGATGYAIGEAEIVAKRQDGFFFERLRGRIRERITEDVKDKDHAALITAFMVGEDDGIAERIWDICRLSGIAHLIAISGSHFLLIAGFVFFAVRGVLAAFPYTALRWPIKKIAAGAAVAVAVFYMLLIGAPIPAQRAVLSVCIIMAAVMLDRDPFTLRIVAFSAMVILLLSPEALAGASFQLSFAAVAGLVAVYESTRGWWAEQFRDAPWYRRYSLYLCGTCLSTFVAGVATAPFSLYHFASMSLTGGMVANLIAVPVSSFITFPAGLIACLLMPLGLEGWALWVTEKSLALIMNVAEAVAAWPQAAQHSDAWPVELLAVMALGGIWLAVWQGRMRYAGLAPIVIACALIPFAPRPDILVSSKVDLFGVRGPDGMLWISSKTKDRFIRDGWVEREGGQGVAYWPEGEGRVISCTPGACTYHAKGHKVVFVTGKDGLPDNCAATSLILTAEPFKAETCREQTTLLDRWDLWRQGSNAIFLHEDGTMEVDSTRERRGIRPWTGRQ